MPGGTLVVDAEERVLLIAASESLGLPCALQARAALRLTIIVLVAQELINKAPQMPADVRWHFIGPLQSNKVRAAAACCALSQPESLALTKLLSHRHPIDPRARARRAHAAQVKGLLAGVPNLAAIETVATPKLARRLDRLALELRPADGPPLDVYIQASADCEPAPPKHTYHSVCVS